VTDPSAAADLTGRALELAPARHPLQGPLVARRAISMFAAGLADDARRFADTALRQSLPPEEEARVRWTIAGMFNISPDVRADNARRALALPELNAETRALLWASLFHNLVVAVRTDEALAVREKARHAVEPTESGTGAFALEVAESALQYQLSHFEQALGLELRDDLHRRVGMDLEGLAQGADRRERLTRLQSSRDDRAASGKADLLMHRSAGTDLTPERNHRCTITRSTLEGYREMGLHEPVRLSAAWAWARKMDGLPPRRQLARESDPVQARFFLSAILSSSPWISRDKFVRCRQITISEMMRIASGATPSGRAIQA